MIILRENEWASNMIKERSLGKKPSETLRMVARFYLDKGYGKRDVRNMLDSFVVQCDPSASLAKWSDSLDHALQRAARRYAVDIDSIPVTKKEMDIIDSLDGKQIKRLAFTLLCLAKYWNTVFPSGDCWVNNKDTEIMSMANINTSIRRQSIYYGKLRDLGLIQFAKAIDNTNVRVCFLDDGDHVVNITDFRNLGYQYLMLHGEPYFVCENCGITTKIQSPGVGRKQKYCQACAVEIKTQQSVNSVMRMRNRCAE